MKESLIKYVDNTLLNIGMPTLKHPIFYHCPTGLRFEVAENGGDNSSFGYFENVYKKVLQIYSDLSIDFNVLRMDILLDAEDSRENQLTNKMRDIHIICDTIGLPFPSEEREHKVLYNSGNGEILQFIQVECYWNIKQLLWDIKILFMQIILADFPSQGGGDLQFSNSVFLINTVRDLIFHLYDDRGLDIVSKDTEALHLLYKKYNSCIMDYDRKRIESIFKQ